MEALFALIFGTPGTWVTFVVSFIVILKKRPMPSRETWALTALLNLPIFVILVATILNPRADTASFVVWVALVLLGVPGPGFALFAWLGGVTLNRRADARVEAQRIAQENAEPDGNVADNSAADQVISGDK
jgi:uncharacterized membrane protein